MSSWSPDAMGMGFRYGCLLGTRPCGLLLALLFLLCARSGTAGQEVIPRMALDLTYDDNLLFSESSPREDWLCEARPALFWRYHTERDLVEINAQARGKKYAKETDLDTLDHNYRLYATTRAGLRTDLSLDAKYLVDTTLDEEFTEEGILLARRDRKAYAITPGAGWQATERSKWTLSLPFYHVNYEGNENVDYETLYAVLTYSYLLQDQRTSIFLQPTIGKADFQGNDTIAGGDTKSYEVMAGVGRQFTERLYGRIMAGASHTKSRTEYKGNYALLYGDEEKTDKTGWVGMAELRWVWDRGDWSLNLLRNVSASGYGETLTRTRLTSSASLRLTERLRLTASVGVGSVESLDDARGRDYMSYDFSPGIVYQVSEWIDAQLSYRYSSIDDKETQDTAERNQVMMRIDIRPSGFTL
jgi:opacity protein-like surface antigen